MERYDHQGGSVYFPEAPPNRWSDEEWFAVSGDLDDFIFYNGWDCSSEEERSFPSQR